MLDHKEERNNIHQLVRKSYKHYENLLDTPLFSYIKEQVQLINSTDLNTDWTAFKFSLLFKNADLSKVKIFFEQLKEQVGKHIEEAKKRNNIPDRDLHIEIPHNQAEWDVEEWAKKFSSHPTLLLDRNTRNFFIQNLPKLGKKVTKKRGDIHRLSEESIKYFAMLFKFRSLDEEKSDAFKRALTLFDRYGSPRMWESWNTLKAHIQISDKQLPPITIQGEEYGMHNIEMRKVHDHDPIQCVVGEIVGNCQSLCGPGEKYVKAIMRSPDAALFAIFQPPKKRGKSAYMPDTVKPKDIFVFMMVWLSKEGYLVIDSMEQNSLKQAHFKDYMKLLAHFSKKYMEENPHIRGVLIGDPFCKLSILKYLPYIDDQSEGKEISPKQSVQACESNDLPKRLMRSRENTLFSEIIIDTKKIREISADEIKKQNPVSMLKTLQQFGPEEDALYFFENYIDAENFEQNVEVLMHCMEGSVVRVVVDTALRYNRNLIYNEKTIQRMLNANPLNKELCCVVFEKSAEGEIDLIIKCLKKSRYIIFTKKDVVFLIDALKIQNDPEKIMTVLSLTKSTIFFEEGFFDYFLPLLGADLLNEYIVTAKIENMSEDAIKNFFENKKFNGLRKKIIAKNHANLCVFLENSAFFDFLDKNKERVKDFFLGEACSLFDILSSEYRVPMYPDEITYGILFVGYYPASLIAMLELSENVLNEQEKVALIHLVSAGNKTLVSELAFLITKKYGESYKQAFKKLLSLPYFSVEYLFLIEKEKRLIPLEILLRDYCPDNMKIIEEVMKRMLEAQDHMDNYIRNRGEGLAKKLHVLIVQKKIKSPAFLQFKERLLFSEAYTALKDVLSHPTENASYGAKMEYAESVLEKFVPQLRLSQLGDLEEKLLHSPQYAYIREKEVRTGFFSRYIKNKEDSPSPVMQKFSQLKAVAIEKLEAKEAGAQWTASS